MPKWVAFEQGGAGATPGMGVSTLIGVGNLDPLGPEFPPPAGGSLGPLNSTLQTPAIGDSTIRLAVVARSNAEVLDPIGATVQFRQSEGAETLSGDEIPVVSEHFNASNDTLPEDHYILGVNFAGDIPVAAFSGEPLSGAPPLSVTFTDESTNTPTSWSWEKSDDGVTWVPFDGTPNAQNPVENFGPGVWSVRLEACNANGCDIHTEEDYITTAITPVASFTFDPDPAEGCDPLSITFTDTSTNTPTSWHWEKSDDGVTWVDFDGTPTAQNPVEDFTVGTWSVRLTATNAAGSNDHTETDIVVSAVAPVASFSATPLSGSPPLSVTFTDTSTGDPTSWHWEKNDGGGWVDFDGTPTAQNPVEDFALGTWSVRLTATNACDSDTHTESNYVEVAIFSVHRWDPATKTAGITLSNGDRRADNGSSGTYQAVKSTLNDLLVGGSRKLYGELEVIACTPGNQFFSILQASVVLAAGTIPIAAAGPNYSANHRNDSILSLNYNNASGWIRTVNAASTGNWNTVGFKPMWAINEATGLAWVGLNGVWADGVAGVGNPGNPATGANPTYTNMTAAILFAMLFLTDNNGGSNIVEIPLTYNPAWVPSGFDPM